MGISLEMYRQRIGCHVGRNMKIKLKYHSKETRKGCKKCKMFSPLLRLLLMFVLLVNVTTTFSTSDTTSYSATTKSWAELRCIKNNYPLNVNFNARYKYGNKKKGGIKIMHWNAGGGFLKNKIHEIENIIGGYRPHLLGISETSFKQGHDISDVQIQDYSIFFSKTLENPSLGVSRCAVYVHKDVVKPKLRLDLMSDDVSSVWIEAHLPRQKKILIGNVYRDWQYLAQNDENVSLKVEAQLERFTILIEQWERSIQSSS